MSERFLVMRYSEGKRLALVDIRNSDAGSRLPLSADCFEEKIESPER